MEWTAEQVATLKRLWLEGYSARRIGEALRVSRNAVLGKINRLEMNTRRASTAGLNTALANRKVKPMLALAADATHRLCQYPVGEPGEPGFHFCHATVETEGNSYCNVHHDLCHQPASYYRSKGAPVPERLRE